MNSSLPLETAVAAGAGRSLAAELGLAENALADALLAWVEASECMFSVKEIASGRNVHVNERLAAFWGRPVADVVGAMDADLMRGAPSGPLLAADRSVVALGSTLVSEHCIERDGVRREFGVFRCVLAAADGGAPRHLLSIWTELTASRRAEERLQRALKHIERQQAAETFASREHTDAGPSVPQTGLHTFAHFDDLLRRELDLSSREHREFALATIALDRQPETASAFGAAARSRVLQALGALLRSNTRAMDASCQIDEDRFIVLLSGVGLATAHWRMEDLRRQCAAHVVVQDGEELDFRVSMGVASFPHTAITEQELTQACEAALAEARSHGGDRVRLASIRFEQGFEDVDASAPQPRIPL
jgi:diguanylate cyclase (GGDEF)-like protein